MGVTLPGKGPSDAQFPASYQAPQNLKKLAKEPSPMAGIGLDDFTEAAIKVVEQAAELGPVVVVGGSQGGVTLNRVGNEVPDLIDRLVYDAAFMCVDLKSAAEYLATPEGRTNLSTNLYSAVVGNPDELGAVRINYRTADPAFLKKAKATFMEDATEAEFLSMLATLQPDESVSVPIENAQADPETWGKVPRTYIRHTLDRMIPIKLQDRMIAEADKLTPENQTDVHTVESAHVVRPDKYDEVIQILDGLAA